MKVELYEKIWMRGAGCLIVIFIVALVYTAAAQAVHPPSHVETIDPATIFTDSDFANFGVKDEPGGKIEVIIVSMMFAFLPAEIRVPSGRPITFRVTSTDVLHGFQVVGTNANVMVASGYVSQFTMTFSSPGEHLIVVQ